MPLLGFNPAAPSNAQGYCTYASNWIPGDTGMQASPSQADIGADAVAAAVSGAVTISKLDATRRTFAGTGTKLYELSGTSWTDRSVGAGTYTANSIWSFAQFGDYTIATNYADAMQQSSTAAFSAITGPKAKIIETVVSGAGGFVFAFNISDSEWGTFTDGWWNSALNDHTSWTVSAATQCTRGRLVGSGGPIVTAKRFGAESIVAYKSREMHHARYIGGDAMWQWTSIPIVGAAGLRAVADIGYAHFIVAQDGFWLYDGARPVRIGNEVREWFSRNVTAAYVHLVEVLYDQDRNRVWIFFPFGGSTTLNRALVWHVGSQQWGLVDTSIETAMMYTNAGTVINSVTGTIDSYTQLIDDPSWSAATRSLAAFNTSHKLVTYTGTPGTSVFQTWDMGDPVRASRLTEATLTYQTRPTTALCRTYASTNLGGTELVASQETAHDSPGSSSTPGRFTLRQHARYHRLEFTFTGACSVTDVTAKIVPTGTR